MSDELPDARPSWTDPRLDDAFHNLGREIGEVRDELVPLKETPMAVGILATKLDYLASGMQQLTDAVGSVVSEQRKDREQRISDAAQQHKDRQAMLVPIVVAAIGAIGTILVKVLDVIHI